MNTIENARGNKIEQEEINRASGEIFTTAIDILKARGVGKRELLFLKYRVFNYTETSRDPGVLIEIRAGNDLDKARQVQFHIEGMEWLYFTKTGAKGHEQFGVYKYNFGRRSSVNSKNTVHGYRNAIMEVKRQVRVL